MGTDHIERRKSPGTCFRPSANGQENRFLNYGKKCCLEVQAKQQASRTLRNSRLSETSEKTGKSRGFARSVRLVSETRLDGALLWQGRPIDVRGDIPITHEWNSSADILTALVGSRTPVDRISCLGPWIPVTEQIPVSRAQERLAATERFTPDAGLVDADADRAEFSCLRHRRNPDSGSGSSAIGCSGGSSVAIDIPDRRSNCPCSSGNRVVRWLK